MWTRRRQNESTKPFNSSGSCRFSLTLRVGTRLKNWKTKPIFRRLNSVLRYSDNEEISISFMLTLPLSGRSIPLIKFSKVDLPEPLRPNRIATLPLGMVRSTSLNIARVCSPSWYLFVRRFIRFLVLIRSVAVVE
jgi:hypothetical protein